MEAASSRNTLSLKITTVWREVSQNHKGDTEDRKEIHERNEGLYSTRNILMKASLRMQD